MDIKALFFAAEGRLNRLSYFLAGIVFFLAVIVLAIAILVLKETFEFILDVKHIELPLIDTIIYIVSIVCCIFLGIKRCHDFNKSGYFLLAYIAISFLIMIVCVSVAYSLMPRRATMLLVLIMVAIINLYLLLKPGTNGENSYGSQPAGLFDLGIKKPEELSSSDISENNNH